MCGIRLNSVQFKCTHCNFLKLHISTVKTSTLPNPVPFTSHLTFSYLFSAPLTHTINTRTLIPSISISVQVKKRLAATLKKRFRFQWRVTLLTACLPTSGECASTLTGSQTYPRPNSRSSSGHLHLR